MDAHTIEHVARLDPITDFRDGAALVEPSGDHLNAVFRDQPAIHRLESVLPGAEHLFGVAEALGWLALEGAIEKSGQTSRKAGSNLSLAIVASSSRVREAIAKDRGRAGYHLVQGDGSRIALGVQVPASGRASMGKKRVEIGASARLDVFGWGAGEREIEEHQP